MPEIAWYWQANCSRLVFHLIGQARMRGYSTLLAGAQLWDLIANAFGDDDPDSVDTAGPGTFFA
jgi:hypothetical protein